ncbi:MAG: hypothetical protein ITD36_03930 [Nitrospira sp.]|nr:hypothetical protein [Nitrospira sp.]MBP0121498.1 hypothetical protein [Nitrospira sp.]MBP0127147.1 hypothetical protein [Nitrospira sp.]MBP0130758.1 hypothetical protein [Nitrospira sp.]
MSADPLLAALHTAGHIRFPTNRSFAQALEQAGGRVVRQATGHLVFYRQDGRRFLATDPAGNPLHECEWGSNAVGEAVLLRARIRLDWGQWVGLKPAGLVNETSLNLASKPGWQRLTADDLRAMAAQALRVPIEDVRFFYRDEDLVIGPTGRATIRQRKDAFYVLQDGDFERARFMSCMGAMSWASIDFLPVVELFKSLLPGTGSAVFEFIRGLYDDQNEGSQSPRPLRYRGIPAYPSEAAFRLFSNFFTPQASCGTNPFTLFMNQERSNQITWLPAGMLPVRYFDQSSGACLTLQGGLLYKVTLASDVAGLSYMSAKGRRMLPCDRSAEIAQGQVILKERERQTLLPVTLPHESREGPDASVAMSPVDWRSVFVQGVPVISPAEAYGAVLLYPEDESEINERAAQPFVADYLHDRGEQDREIGAALSHAEQVLIDNGDAVIATCVLFDRPRDYMVRIHAAALAQKQAQQLWTVCAEMQRWDWLSRIRFLPVNASQDQAVPPLYDLIYWWIPYGDGEQPARLAEGMKEMARTLRGGGNAFVVGPAQLGRHGSSTGLHVCWEEPVEQLPTFRMHRTILPKAKLRAGLTLFHLKKV